MSQPFRVMLAGKVDDVDKQVRYPVLASTKLDGIRAYVRDGKVWSRANKPIPNAAVQQEFGRKELEGVDGELIVEGAATAPNCFLRTTSAVMSAKAVVPLKFYAFDLITDKPFMKRLQQLERAAKGRCGVFVVEQRVLTSRTQLAVYEDMVLTLGYEGVMLRAPNGPYKQGRSTVREGYLLKLKRFEDDEAEIVGFEEFMHNLNDAQISETGRTKRSSRLAGMVPGDKLGAFKLRRKDGVEFNVGAGLTEVQRVMYWKQRDLLLGRLIKYRHQKVGAKDAPRLPVFVGLRDKLDL